MGELLIKYCIIAPFHLNKTIQMVKYNACNSKWNLVEKKWRQDGPDEMSWTFRRIIIMNTQAADLGSNYLLSITLLLLSM